jgi:hypothetical protein
VGFEEVRIPKKTIFGTKFKKIQMSEIFFLDMPLMELGVLFLHIGLLLFQPADLILRVLGLELEHFHCNATRHSSSAIRVEKDQRIMLKLNIFAIEY